MPVQTRAAARSRAEPTATSDTILSLEGLTLKFDTLASIQPYLDQLHAVKALEEVRFGGNTLGIEACAGVGDALSTKQGLQVSLARFCASRLLCR